MPKSIKTFCLSGSPNELLSSISITSVESSLNQVQTIITLVMGPDYTPPATWRDFRYSPAHLASILILDPLKNIVGFSARNGETLIHKIYRDDFHPCTGDTEKFHGHFVYDRNLRLEDLNQILQILAEYIPLSLNSTDILQKISQIENHYGYNLQKFKTNLPVSSDLAKPFISHESCQDILEQYSRLLQSEPNLVVHPDSWLDAIFWGHTEPLRLASANFMNGFSYSAIHTVTNKMLENYLPAMKNNEYLAAFITTVAVETITATATGEYTELADKILWNAVTSAIAIALSKKFGISSTLLLAANSVAFLTSPTSKALISIPSTLVGRVIGSVSGQIINNTFFSKKPQLINLPEQSFAPSGPQTRM